MYAAAQQLRTVPCRQPIAPGAGLNALKNLGLFGLSETLWVWGGYHRPSHHQENKCSQVQVSLLVYLFLSL